MSDDPLNEKGKVWTTTVEGVTFIISTVDDYNRYVNALHEQAADAVVSLWLDKQKTTLNPTYAPAEPPCFFDYWCDQNGIDPKQRWPEMRELKEQHATRLMREHEIQIERLKENIKLALHKEKQRVLSNLPSGSSKEAKIKQLSKINQYSPSKEWENTMKVFTERSRWADTKLRRRLGRWVNSDLICWPEETPDEAELIANINSGFLQDLQLRFGGGEAHKHEQQRKQSATTSFHSVEEDRARMRAELALAQQSMTRAQQAHAERAHKRGEAEHTEQTGASMETTVAAPSVDGVIADILDPRAQADDRAIQALLDYQASTAENDATRAPGNKSKNMFDATLERFDYQEGDDPTWVNHRFDGVDWCDGKGRHLTKRARPSSA